MHEGFETLPLVFNPMLFHLAILTRDNALLDLEDVEDVQSLQPSGGRDIPLEGS